MSVSQGDRNLAFNQLTNAVGSEAANVIMELLPSQPASELVTRHDLLVHGNQLQAEMAELRADLQGQMAELRSNLEGQMAELRADLQGQMAELRADLQGQMAELRADLQGQMAELRAELRTEMAGLRSDVKGEIAELRAEFGRVYRWGAALMATNTIAVVTALLT